MNLSSGCSSILVQELLEIIILLSFLHVPGLHDDGSPELQVLEFFAGAARIARMGKALNLQTAALDRDMDPSMDINTAAGFLLLVFWEHFLYSFPTTRCNLAYPWKPEESEVTPVTYATWQSSRFTPSAWHLLQHLCFYKQGNEPAMSFLTNGQSHGAICVPCQQAHSPA